MVQIQLDFFKTSEQCELEAMRKEVHAMRQSLDKMRKALFAKNGEIMKITLDVRERLDILEYHICKGKDVCETG